jgi:hypothetical protein
LKVRKPVFRFAFPLACHVHHVIVTLRFQGRMTAVSFASCSRFAAKLTVGRTFPVQFAMPAGGENNCAFRSFQIRGATG